MCELCRAEPEEISLAVEMLRAYRKIPMRGVVEIRKAPDRTAEILIVRRETVLEAKRSRP